MVLLGLTTVLFIRTVLYQKLMESLEKRGVFIARSVANPTGEEGLTSYAPPPSATFPDMPTDHWAYKHVEYVKSKEIVKGYPDGTYQPDVVVTRDQMAVYVARAFQLPL